MIVKIRQATIADFPAMIEMGSRFLNNSRYAKHLVDNPEQMHQLGEALLRGGGMLVAEREKPVGMLGYIIYKHLISGEMTAGEVFWWVEPEHRGDGLRLLREFERIAREAGAVKIQMIAPEEQVGKIYERLGYGYMESTYQRTL